MKHSVQLPSIGELNKRQLPGMEAADTKDEALEAIGPLAGLAVMCDD